MAGHRRFTPGPQENPELARSRRAQDAVKATLFAARGRLDLAQTRVRKSLDGTQVAYDADDNPLGILDGGSFVGIDPEDLFYDVTGHPVAYRDKSGKVIDLPSQLTPSTTEAPAVPTSTAPTTPVEPVVKSSRPYRPPMTWPRALAILKATQSRLETRVVKDTSTLPAIRELQRNLGPLIALMERGDPRLPDAEKVLKSLGLSVMRDQANRTGSPIAANPLVAAALALPRLPSDLQRVVKEQLAVATPESRLRARRALAQALAKRRV